MLARSSIRTRSRRSLESSRTFCSHHGAKSTSTPMTSTAVPKIADPADPHTPRMCRNWLQSEKDQRSADDESQEDALAALGERAADDRRGVEELGEVVAFVARSSLPHGEGREATQEQRPPESG